MSAIVREPGDTPPTPPSQGPKSTIPPKDPYTDYRINTSEAGRVLPLAYGTVRTAGNVIERYTQALGIGGSGIYVKGTVFGVTEGQIVSNNGNIYICTGPGNTAGGDGPSGNSTSILDGTVTWSYTPQGYQHTFALAFCEGAIFGSGKWWVDKKSYASLSALPWAVPFWYQLYLGDATGMNPVPVWFPANGTYPRNYANTAFLAAVINNGSDNSLPQISGEIAGVFAASVGADASPADIATDLITHARRGASLPSTRVDPVTTGTGASSWRTYCTAYGLNLSWLIDAQQSALQLLAQLLQATNTEPVWTNRPDGAGGMFKFVPLGDQALTANGVTFTPNTTPAYNLGPDDLLEPVKILRVPSIDTYNSVPIEYVDRASGYTKIVVDDPDMADVDVRNLKRASATSLPMVLQPASAIMLSRIAAQRSLNVRRIFTLKLPWRFLLLEPTDLLTVSDPVMGLVKVPVRVTCVVEDQSGDGSFTITAEDWPAAVASAAAYTPQAGDGFQPSLSTAAQGLVLLPGQVPPGTITDAGSSRGANVDNLWPNPGSEAYPPDGADLNAPEWYGRYAVGDAFSGSFVRHFAATTNQFFGMFWDTNVGSSSRTNSVTLAASAGEAFYMEAQVRANHLNAGGVYLQIRFQSATRTMLGYVASPTINAASWTKTSARGVAPAGTAFVSLEIIVQQTAADPLGWGEADAIYARRALANETFDRQGFGALRSPNYTEDGSANPTAGVKIDLSGTAGTGIKLAPGCFQIAGYTFDNGTNGQFWGRLKNALQNSNTDFWYNGSNLPGGIPDIQPAQAAAGAQLGFQGASGLADNGEILVHCNVKIPYDITKNLDALRRVQLDWYDVTPTLAWSTSHAAIDQGHGPGNNDITIPCIGIVFNHSLAVQTNSYKTPQGYVRLTLWNVAGYSAAKDFDTRAVNNVGPGNNWPVLTGGIGGVAPPAGGGGGGGLCPAPWVKIRLVGGREVDAADLHGGARVVGFDEHDPTRLKVGTVRMPTLGWQERYDLALSDGRVLAFSRDHRLVVDGQGWKKVQHLIPGDKLVGLNGPMAVKAVKSTGRGQVVAFQVEGCATYFAGGIASHNLKP